MRQIQFVVLETYKVFIHNGILIISVNSYVGIRQTVSHITFSLIVNVRFLNSFGGQHLYSYAFHIASGMISVLAGSRCYPLLSRHPGHLILNPNCLYIFFFKSKLSVLKE